jgi:tetratricopeptide (TPR) repeat protein
MATAAALVIAFAACFHFIVMKDNRLIWGSGAAPGKYPSAAINFIKSNSLKGEMYNDYGLGGPLIWGLYPERKVFIDGRTTFYGGEFFKKDFDFHARPGPAAWNALQKKYNLNFAALRLDSWRVYNTIKDYAKWRTVFWDNEAVVLANPVPENQNVIERYAYNATSPYNAVDLAVNWKQLPEEERGIVEKELGRSLKQSPRNIIAIRALTFIHYYEGRREEALRFARRGIAIDPGIAGLHAVAGEILNSRGSRDEAMKEFRAAAKIMPEYKKIISRLKTESEK